MNEIIYLVSLTLKISYLLISKVDNEGAKIKRDTKTANDAEIDAATCEHLKIINE